MALSANMNRGLIQGARQVADAENKGRLAGSKAFQEMGEHLSEGIAKVVQKRNNEFNEIMKKQLGKEGLSDEEYQKLYKRFKKRRAAYVYLNKKERMDFERDTLKEAEEHKKLDADKEEIAETLTDEDNEINPDDVDNSTIQDIVTGKIEPTKDENGRVGYALSSDALQEFVIKDENGNNRLKSYRASWEDERFTVSEDGKYKTDKFGNKYTNDEAGFKDYQRSAKLYWIRKAKETGDKLLMYNSTTGKREYMTPEEAEALLQDKEKFVTMDEIKEHVKSRGKDTKASDAINGLIANGSEEAKNLKPGDDITFNREATKEQFSKALDNTDLHKAATKKMVGNTSWKEDMTEKLQTMKYKEFGIDESTVERFDPTPNDGVVSAEDAAVIVDKIMEDDDMLKGYLTDYLTIYKEREFKNNIPKDLQQNNQTVSVQGGSVDEEGVWTPNA